jgi:hypothetical protein
MSFIVLPVTMVVMETKKAWDFLLLAYPRLQALALPLFKDKQRKPAHAK